MISESTTYIVITALFATLATIGTVLGSYLLLQSHTDRISASIVEGFVLLPSLLCGVLGSSIALFAHKTVISGVSLRVRVVISIINVAVTIGCAAALMLG